MKALVFIIKIITIGIIAAPGAWAITIDGFDGDGTAKSTNVGLAGTLVVSSPSAIGGTRTLATTKTAGSEGEVKLETKSSILFHSQDSGVSGFSAVVWDGDSNPTTVNFSGLGGIDLTDDGATAIKLEGVNFDFPGSQPIDISIEVFSASDANGLTFMKRDVTLNQFLFNQEIVIPFTDFTASNSLAGFNNVGAISLVVNGSKPNVDFSLAGISTNGTCAIVPSIGEDVIDECGVCGGQDLLKDVCGVCSGTGQSCIDCAGVPNGPAKLDQCMECNGNGLSCIDCNGVPFGSAKLDSCGVCNGDGTTCNQCDKIDINQTLTSLTKSTKLQRKIALRSLRKFRKSDKPYYKGMKAKITECQVELDKLIGQLPSDVQQCAPNPLCTTINANAEIKVTYEDIARKLYKKTAEIIKHKTPSSGTPSACTSGISNCLKKIKSQAIEQRTQRAKARKQRNNQRKQIKSVPGSYSVCQ